jgi:hypothetical protein
LNQYIEDKVGVQFSDCLGLIYAFPIERSFIGLDQPTTDCLLSLDRWLSTNLIGLSGFEYSSGSDIAPFVIAENNIYQAD